MAVLKYWDSVTGTWATLPAAGPQGPAGATGATGPQGPQGPQAFRDYAGTGVVAGPSYGGSGAIFSTLTVTVPSTTAVVIAGLSSRVQNNGVNGTLYGTYYGFYMDGALSYHVGGVYGSVNGAYSTVGGAAMWTGLSAAAHSISLRIVAATATPTWGMYQWNFFAVVL